MDVGEIVSLFSNVEILDDDGNFVGNVEIRLFDFIGSYILLFFYLDFNFFIY